MVSDSNPLPDARVAAVLRHLAENEPPLTSGLYLNVATDSVDGSLEVAVRLILEAATPAAPSTLYPRVEFAECADEDLPGVNEDVRHVRGPATDAEGVHRSPRST